MTDDTDKAIRASEKAHAAIAEYSRNYGMSMKAALLALVEKGLRYERERGDVLAETAGEETPEYEVDDE